MKKRDFKVTLLGTGTPIPSVDRYGPCTLIEAGDQKLLIDAGRGAPIRLSQVNIPVGRINALFLTHFHSDHTVGLPDIWLTGWLESYFGTRRTPFRVVGPVGTKVLMSSLEQAYAADIKIRMEDERLALDGVATVVEEYDRAGVVYEKGGVKVIAFDVDHGDVIKPAYGYRIEYGGRSSVISGDTRFNENVIAHGAGVDLLVHEVAIARPELISEAYIQRILAHHTTAREAGIVFARARPKLAVYTHLVFLTSKEVPPASVDELIAETRKTYSGPLEVGEDLMCFEIGQTVSVRRLGRLEAAAHPDPRGDRMNRRELITLLGGATATLPFGLRAQSKEPQIVGFLSSNTFAAGGHLASAFVARLRALGWTEGQNLRVEYRWGGGQTTKFRELAAELVAAGSEVIVTSGNVPAIAARQATDTVPIVLAASGDIISTGLVKSLARPGGNVTGLTFAPEDTVGKRCELLREAVSGLTRVAVLYNPDANPEQVVALRQVAPALDVILDVFEFRRVADLERIATFSERSKIGALFVVSDPLVFTHRTALNAFAIREKLPTIHSLREYVDEGGLMSYGPDFRDFFRHAAVYVDKVLRGANPADLPVERPTIFRLVVNLQTARVIGLRIPPMLLARADEVIE